MLQENKTRALDLSTVRSYFLRDHWLILRKIIELADQRQIPLYIVGGFVRDLLLRRRKSQYDIDLVIEGDAIEFAKEVQDQWGGKLIIHHKFGTATWINTNNILGLRYGLNHSNQESHHDEKLFHIDFITARREKYPYPGSLPLVFPSDLTDDILRRDFTINTLALRLNHPYFGRLIDQCNGIRDLALGRIRTLHEESFKDDPTRIFRAVRYEQRYQFQLTQTTLSQLDHYKKYIIKLSSQRIRHEFDKIFSEDQRVKMMERLEALSVLKEIQPRLSWNKWHSKVIHALPYEIPCEYWGIKNCSDVMVKRLIIYTIWFSTHQDILLSLFDRFSVENSLRKIILSVMELKAHSEHIKNGSISQMVQILEKSNPIAIYVYFHICEDDLIQKKINSYIHVYKNQEISARVRQYIYARSPKGETIGYLLKELRKLILDGRINSDHEAIKWVDQNLDVY